MFESKLNTFTGDMQVNAWFFYTDFIGIVCNKWNESIFLTFFVLFVSTFDISQSAYNKQTFLYILQ